MRARRLVCAASLVGVLLFGALTALDALLNDAAAAPPQPRHHTHHRHASAQHTPPAGLAVWAAGATGAVDASSRPRTAFDEADDPLEWVLGMGLGGAAVVGVAALWEARWKAERADEEEEL